MTLKFGQKTKKPVPQAEKSNSGVKPKFKYGAAAASAIDEERAKAEARQSQYGKAFRFRIKYEGSKTPEVMVTLLDGELDENGMLDIPYIREHTVKVNGSWANYICTEEEEGFCPLCNDGDTPSLVGFLSVLDHTPYKKKNGETQEVSKRLLVAKKNSLQLLTNQATKRQGLTGCTFEVQRTGDREPAVGNVWDFVQKDNLTELASENGWDAAMVEPLNYEEEIVYHSAEELLELGVGKPQTGPGTQKPLDDDDIAGKM